jgi:glycosyltransferase involved in cell wall biosynthesis
VPNLDGSRFWGSPVKLFEYMAMGKPVVASGIGQVLEIVDDGYTGLLVEPARPDALCGAIDSLVRDPGLRQSIGAAARTQAVRHHSWDDHVRRIVGRLGVSDV